MQLGKAFENDVCTLLKLHGWAIQQETIIGHKRIDAYAEKWGYFRQLERVAVECKDYDGPLRQDEVTKIYANYLPLLQRNHIDNIILVTRNPIAPSAEAYCSTAHHFTHLTFIELLNSLIDFGSYIQGVVSQYDTDRLGDYYVNQRYRSGTHYKADDNLHESFHDTSRNIDDYLIEWVSNSSTRPIAVLAGYGMGKTTLSKRLSYDIAKKHLADPLARIPILIRLDQISTEQSLEGLLGKHFTSYAHVTNYNFNIFMELNRRGRFVVLLDGFDEMKQTMSWDVMRFNLSQLNRLVLGDSKVIIGGRPNVFLTDDEYMEALHGKRRVLGRMSQIPGWPDYEELHLEPFNDEQISQFVETYAPIAHDHLSKRTRRSLNRLFQLLKSQESSPLAEIARRPVQLKMMVDILPTWEGALDKLTLCILYSEFIDLMIRREVLEDKITRKRFTIKERRSFASELAWWIWNEGASTGVHASTIPDELFSGYGRKDEHLDDIRRDLIAACFLEFKPPETLYFPHRSFQEFLVAEHLVQLCESRTRIFEGKVNINREIMEFFEGLAGRKAIEGLRSALWESRGLHPDWVVDVIVATIRNIDEFEFILEREYHPWPYVCMAIAIINDNVKITEKHRAEILRKYLQHVPHGADDVVKAARLMIVLQCVISAMIRNNDAQDVVLKLAVRAGTKEWFEREGSCTIIEVIKKHIDPDYCCLESWQKPTFSNAYNCIVELEGTTTKKRHHAPVKPNGNRRRRR